MEHHGNKLAAILRAKGLTIRQVASDLGLHRNTVDNHIKQAFISMKSLKLYANEYGFDVKPFYEAERPSIDSELVLANVGAMVPLSMFLTVNDKYISALEELNVLRNEYMKLSERFFPNAVQHFRAIA